MVLPVALLVAGELGLPELVVFLRRRAGSATVVTVPETTVHENDRFPRTKDNIRRPGQVTPMQPVAKAHAVQKSSNDHLRFGILPAHSGHHPPPRVGRVGEQTLVHQEALHPGRDGRSRVTTPRLAQLVTRFEPSLQGPTHRIVARPGRQQRSHGSRRDGSLSWRMSPLGPALVGPLDRRWLVIADDGRHVTVGRETDPTQDEIKILSGQVDELGVAAWLAVQGVTTTTRKPRSS